MTRSDLSPLTFELLPPRDALALRNMIKAVKDLTDLGVKDFTMVSRSNRATIEACQRLCEAVPVAYITPHIRSGDFTADDQYLLQSYAEKTKHPPCLFVVRGDTSYVDCKSNHCGDDSFDVPYSGETVLSLIKKFHAMGWRVSSACHPEGHPLNQSDRYENALAKFEAGCCFLVSQVVFDVTVFDHFYKVMHQRMDVLPPVKASVMVSSSAKFIQKFCLQNGITVQDDHIKDQLSLVSNFMFQKIPLHVVTLNQWDVAKKIAVNIF